LPIDSVTLTRIETAAIAIAARLVFWVPLGFGKGSAHPDLLSRLRRRAHAAERSGGEGDDPRGDCGRRLRGGWIVVEAPSAGLPMAIDSAPKTAQAPAMVPGETRFCMGCSWVRRVTLE
jgi:hypothetical protein